MKKNNLVTVCLLSCACFTSQAAQAEDHDYLSCFTSKLSQGVANLATGFIEIPKNVVNISHDDNIFVGLTWGLLRGVGHAVSRTVIGGAEFISSPIPSDDFATPSYVWDRFSEDTRYFGYHYPGYWTTYGPLDNGK